MREWWANVYAPDRHMTDRGTHIKRHPTRHAAEDGSSLGNGRHASGLRYRIHVRLKPEGAPRRYLCHHDRQWWETMYEYAKGNDWRKGDCDCA